MIQVWPLHPPVSARDERPMAAPNKLLPQSHSPRFPAKEPPFEIGLHDYRAGTRPRDRAICACVVRPSERHNPLISDHPA
ncbi:hypothetical protein BP00DRAFT_426296 [Aspergillus indologenus CBS 114.80]|uniref:Uncharacterized protein n=1 Tax=Aspergillus indologenus CBS 114.80 TaxID=1450541 RepID=A0A2V5J7Q9_9EURO|nr:hypothetical protein BP00DRAFT_426296 [Aspergillus indologenus CBS 114.80]